MEDNCKARKLSDGTLSCVPCNARWDADDAAPSCRPNPESLQLAPGESKAYAVLRTGEDTAIPAIYHAITGRVPAGTSRDTQRFVSATLHRLNKKLAREHFEVVPGRLKQTYTLQRIG